MNLKRSSVGTSIGDMKPSAFVGRASATLLAIDGAVFIPHLTSIWLHS